MLKVLVVLVEVLMAVLEVKVATLLYLILTQLLSEVPVVEEALEEVLVSVVLVVV